MGNCNCMKENDRSEIKLEIGRAREIGNHILIGTGDLECDERIFVYPDN